MKQSFFNFFLLIAILTAISSCKKDNLDVDAKNVNNQELLQIAKNS